MLRNFTIITSGGCNAKCDFCPDPMNYKESGSYLENLKAAVDVLPPNYLQVSISGGEPTISPHLHDVLKIVKESKCFQKVVLTTNGTKLEQHLDKILDVVHHINISRHAVGYEANVGVFKNKQIITDEGIARVVEKASKKLVDVTLNYVYTEGTVPTLEQALEFVAYAKSLGCSVSFRYDQRANSLSTTLLEREFIQDGYTLAEVGSCPVCLTFASLVMGVNCTFKSAFQEPGSSYGSQTDPYELIYHVSGKLCLDWDQKIEYLVPLTPSVRLPFSSWVVVKDTALIEHMPTKAKPKKSVDAPVSYHGFSGCGGGRTGCG